MKKSFSPRIVLFGVIAIAVLFAVLALLINHPLERITLAQNRLKWNTQGIRSYDYNAELICNCTEHNAPTPVQVRDNKALNGAGRLYTVEGLFEIVQDALDQNAESVVVTYDSAQGFPAHIEIDRSLQESGDEIAYQITDFVAR